MSERLSSESVWRIPAFDWRPGATSLRQKQRMLHSSPLRIRARAWFANWGNRTRAVILVLLPFSQFACTRAPTPLSRLAGAGDLEIGSLMTTSSEHP